MTGSRPIASPARTVVAVLPVRTILYLGDIRMFSANPCAIAGDIDMKLLYLDLA